MMKSVVFLALCGAVLYSSSIVGASKIIMFSLFGSTSHLNLFYSVGEALADAGHEVTFVISYPPRNSSKIKEINIPVLHELMRSNASERAKGIMEVMNSGGGGSGMSNWKSVFVFLPKLCATVIGDKILEDLVKGGEQYDIAIQNGFLNDCTLGISAKVAKYLVQLASISPTSVIAYEQNIPFPYSTIPNIMLAYPSNMNFYQRALNSVAHLGFYIATNWYVYPTVNEIVREKYPTLPSVQEAKSKTSLLLVNRMYAIDGSVPTLPYVQEIGGINNKPAKELPQDFKAFVDSSGEAGIVYVALGSVVPEEFMPEDKKRMFIEAFSKIPQRVVWKFKEKRTDLPPNVKTVSWAPQQDILGHPKCKAFISHGGHLSIDEALYHGVPIIGMPIFGDQPANVAHLVHEGWGLELLWKDLTVDTLVEKLKEITNNPRYKEKTAVLSKRMRDQPQTAKERAVYWIEYVLRHDGAKHLRTSADNLNFFQYFLLDVIGAALLVLFVTLYIAYKVLYFIFCKLCCGRSKNKSKENAKKLKNKKDK